MPLQPLKEDRILARQGRLIPSARPGIRLAGLGALLLSGAVAAVAVTLPNAPSPVASVVSEALPAPALDYVEVDTAPFVRELTVRTGDTLPAVLSGLGIQSPSLMAYLTGRPDGKALARRLTPGTVIVATTDRHGEPQKLTIPLLDENSALVATRSADGFSVDRQPLRLERRLEMASGEVSSSLFAATDEAGLPDEVATALADIFEGQIDFIADLRPGDRFSVVYEALYINGAARKTGRLMSAEIITGGRRHTAIWFSTGAGMGAYYAPNGQSLQSGFLRSPVEFTRVSSGFSMRKHPILKEWRAHKGTDFAAPTGTKVRAAADGTVAFVGRQSGYGKFIVLEHADGYSTAYGHLHGFAAGLREGQKITQGQLIGYVGSTGWATGPHLHYELRVNGEPRDPLRVALPAPPSLSDKQLASFKRQTVGLLAQLRIATPRVRLASAG